MVEGRPFRVRYPGAVWRKLPPEQRIFLAQNVTFGATQVLPLMAGREAVSYDFPQPLFCPFFFQNHLFDLLSCEDADGARHLDYIRRFYNLDYEFAPEHSPGPPGFARKPRRRPAAVLPFSFGKESLVTLGLCLELGIKPVLMYCQEPAHPFEEGFKRRMLKELGKEFGLETHFVRFEPGMFRYGRAFKAMPVTELGWGSQTTLLQLLCVPFAVMRGAPYILIGSEQSNNEFSMRRGWRLYPSYDQTSLWTAQQRHMARLASGGLCGAYSMLEPLEEIVIFSMLHHRYPRLGKYQFSCSAQRALRPGSAWCHRCYKCDRMFLFARCCGIDPESLGFREDLFNRPGRFRHYFGKAKATGSPYELDFAFLAAYRKGFLGRYHAPFVRQKLKRLRPWREYLNHFGQAQPHSNLPPALRRRIMAVVSSELRRFRRLICDHD